jgi:hypothetical protein
VTISDQDFTLAMQHAALMQLWAVMRVDTQVMHVLRRRKTSTRGAPVDVRR